MMNSLEGRIFNENALMEGRIFNENACKKSIVIAFDLDDTLAPESMFILSGIHHIASKIPNINPLRIIGCMESALFSRTNHYSALERLLESEGLKDKVDMKKIVAEFRNHRPDPAIYHLAPSVKSTLEHLKAKGATLALITDGRSLTQRNKIDALGLTRYFADEDIIISGETGYDKTHPGNFIAVQERHPEARHFIYVGDNPRKDFLHPRLLGWQTFCLPSTPLSIHPHTSIPPGVIPLPSFMPFQVMWLLKR